ncbi:MAG TPA: GntR family transcriptional regulator [Lachnospiraceae bacterium]|nr:GntR family transcriptional regulator [Lachnospiraceae bacterium]
MKIDFNDVVPIYIQIADAIEDDILMGRLKEGENCYSQIQIAKEVNINPATAAKGIRVLVERGILKKVRGQAMTISENAVAMIKERKLEQMLSEMIENLVRESKKLGVSEEGLIEKIRHMYQEE